MADELRFRLMKLHQEKLEVALVKYKGWDSDKALDITLYLQEIEDICEFFNTFLYD